MESNICVHKMCVISIQLLQIYICSLEIVLCLTQRLIILDLRRFIYHFVHRNEGLQ